MEVDLLIRYDDPNAVRYLEMEVNNYPSGYH